MDQKRQIFSLEENRKEHRLEEPSTEKESTPIRTRILAGLGALFVIILVILYTYSLATGKIFAW